MVREFLYRSYFTEGSLTVESIDDFFNIGEIGIHASDKVVVRLVCVAIAVQGISLACGEPVLHAGMGFGRSTHHPRPGTAQSPG